VLSRVKIVQTVYMCGVLQVLWHYVDSRVYVIMFCVFGRAGRRRWYGWAQTHGAEDSKSPTARDGQAVRAS